MCYLEAVEHDLPADAPGAKRRGLPVVFLEADIVLAKVDADGFDAFEVQVLHIVRRGLQNDLHLCVLEQTIGVFAVPPVGRTAARLNVSYLVGLGSQDTEKRFGTHRAGADFHIVRLGYDATAFGPVVLQLK